MRVMVLVLIAGCSFAIPSHVWHPTVEDGETELACPSHAWPATDTVIGIAGTAAGSLLLAAPDTSPWLVPPSQALGTIVLVPSLIYLASALYGFHRAHDCNRELDAIAPGKRAGR